MAQDKNWTQVGKGIEVRQSDEFTEVRFRNDGNTGPSASGKTIGVATTGGNTLLPNGVYIGVNAYRKP